MTVVIERNEKDGEKIEEEEQEGTTVRYYPTPLHFGTVLCGGRIEKNPILRKETDIPHQQVLIVRQGARKQKYFQRETQLCRCHNGCDGKNQKRPFLDRGRRIYRNIQYSSITNDFDEK